MTQTNPNRPWGTPAAMLKLANDIDPKTRSGPPSDTRLYVAAEELRARAECAKPGAPVAAQAQPDPLHITHGPLMREAAALLRLRKPTPPDFERVATELEQALNGESTPAGEPSQAWLDIAAGTEDHFRGVTKMIPAQQPVSGADGLPIELRGISETAAEGRGVWRSCSGCHELNEGHDTGPRSKVFGCALGVGCSECGGIGAVWDTTDYGAMGDALAASMAQPQPSGNAGERTPQDFALEHAEYLAQRAERMLDAINAVYEAEQAVEDSEVDDDEHQAKIERHEQALETQGDAIRALSSAVYEFRKRRDRAALAGQASGQDRGDAAYQRGLREGRQEGDDFIKGCLV